MSDTTTQDRGDDRGGDDADTERGGTLDRRSFLGFVGASGAAVATGAVAAGALAAGCQGGPTPAPNGTPPATPDEPKPTSAEELGVAGPVRLAIVPDEVAPAFTFRPLGRAS